MADETFPPAVIARLDPKSGLPDFGIKIVEIGNIRFSMQSSIHVR
jgi:hypothetical protein